MTTQDKLERATSDYLSISRGAHLYSSAEDYAEAEERAWMRLTKAHARVEAESIALVCP